MHLYCDVTSLYKFGTLKSYLFLALSRVPLNANFDFDVSLANDVAIGVAKYALPGKVIQGSPCPEVRSLINEIRII